jgi:hypothetical protein
MSPDCMPSDPEKVVQWLMVDDDVLFDHRFMDVMTEEQREALPEELHKDCIKRKAAINRRWGIGQSARLVTRANEAKRAKTRADAVIYDGAPMVLTESNLARAFARRFADELRFNHTSGKWHTWTGSHWQPDGTCLAFDWVRQFTEALNTEGKAKWARAAVFSAVERIAETDRAFARVEDDFDRDQLLLGTPAGTVRRGTRTTRTASMPRTGTR